MCVFPTRESLMVEFKSDKRCLPDSDLIDVVVAFANTEGGELYLGIEDDGTVTGLHPAHRDITRLTAFIANKTIPPVSTRAELLRDGKREVLRVSVPKYTSIVASASGKIQRRRLKADHTPENVPLYPYEIPQRLASLSLLDFSAQPLPEAAREDFSPVERERLREIIRTYHGEDTLLELEDVELEKALRLVTRQGESYRPTVAGMLLLGRPDRLRELIPTAESSLQVLEGTQLRVNESFTLPLLQSIEKIYSHFKAVNREEEMDVGPYRIPLPHYDPQAFREALVNAYCHRDYSMLGRVRVLFERDGLTISNPGGFIDGVSMDSLLDAEPHGRNPVLADCLKRIGLAERSGRGIDRIYAGSLRYGKLPPDYSRSMESAVRVYIPDSKPDQAFVRFLVEEREKHKREFTIYELLILNLLRAKHRMMHQELAGAAGVPVYKLSSTLETLVEAGLVEAMGKGQVRHYMLSARVYGSQKNVMGYVRQTDIDAIRFPELIEKLAKKQGSVTRADVAELLHLSPSQAYHQLDKLKKQGRLVLKGRGKTAHYCLAGK